MTLPPADTPLVAAPTPVGSRRRIRMALVRVMLGAVPSYALNRTRLMALRACGIHAGRATLFWGLPQLSGTGSASSKLHVGTYCGFNDGCVFELEAPITIGDHVSVGHEVRFLTNSPKGGIEGAAPITVRNGVWIGARCTLQGGVTVGEGAVIGAGTTVASDVPANTLAIGARLIPLPDVFDPGHSRQLFWERMIDAWKVEFSNLRWRLMFCMFLERLLPDRRAAGLRTALIRAIGLRIGKGTRFSGMPVIQSVSTGSLKPKLQIGTACSVGAGVILELGGRLTIGDRVVVGDGVVMVTTTHQLGPSRHRAGVPISNPVVIGNDVSIGAGAIILPGTTIGDAACVLPGAVVNASVAPGVTVGGLPARPVRPA